ncbi:MAG: hypothetical protein COW65_17595 [Cytophagales bacterium CG18_big_fil_WC_8_21_14_2_50_42_9]|nr:MAG: hypothetical protein COW65_17595 [Cytophagales bacterium CG18_big_fil_WC_8_21_14_2_50_42_9]
MLAITSLLDTEHTEIVNTIIKDFEKEFGVKQVQATPDPHVTYLTTDALDMNLLKSYLERTSKCHRVFHMYTTGIGVFPGEHPVIYIPVLRTPPLNKFQSALYKDVSKLSTETGTFSQPKIWLPHISLALGDTSLDLLTPMFKYLAKYNFDWQIPVDNLTIFKQSENKTSFEIESEYNFANPILT